MMGTNDFSLFAALIWCGLMTISVIPCTELIRFDDPFNCSWHQYDGDNDVFVVPCTYIMGNNDTSDFPNVDMMRTNTISCVPLPIWRRNKIKYVLFNDIPGSNDLFVVPCTFMIRTNVTFGSSLWSELILGVRCIDMMEIIKICIFFALIWRQLMTFFVVPFIDMIWNNDKFGCSLHCHDAG